MHECRNAGMQECKNTGIQECRNAGMQECRNAGMQECRNAGMQECKNARKGRFAFLHSALTTALLQDPALCSSAGHGAFAYPDRNGVTVPDAGSKRCRHTH